VVAVAGAIALGVILALVSRGSSSVTPLTYAPITAAPTPGVPPGVRATSSTFNQAVTIQTEKLTKHRVVDALCVRGYRFARAHTAACFVFFSGGSSACSHIWWADRSGNAIRIERGPSMCGNNAATRALGKFK
jgi:hypothetical protein